MQNSNDINDMLDHPVGGLRKSHKFWGSYPSSEVPWPIDKPSAARRLDFDKPAPKIADDEVERVNMIPLLEAPTPVKHPMDNKDYSPHTTKAWPSVPTGMTLPPTGGWASLFQAEIDSKLDTMTPPIREFHRG